MEVGSHLVFEMLDSRAGCIAVCLSVSNPRFAIAIIYFWRGCTNTNLSLGFYFCRVAVVVVRKLVPAVKLKGYLSSGPHHHAPPPGPELCLAHMPSI